MRGEAMKKVLEELKTRGVPVANMRALEVFGREGDWQTVVYADKVKHLEVWEILPECEPGLRKNLPNAKLRFTDSIKEIHNPEHRGKFDFIVVDNPQNCYGSHREYCEHFELLPEICALLDNKGILIFDINKEPFNFAESPDWQTRRAEFYGLPDTSKLTIEWMLEFYTKLFADYGYDTEWSFPMSRGDFEHNDQFHYLVFSLQKHV